MGFDIHAKSESENNVSFDFVSRVFNISYSESEAWKRPFRVINFSSVEIDRRMREKQYEMWKSISDDKDALE